MPVDQRNQREGSPTGDSVGLWPESASLPDFLHAITHHIGGSAAIVTPQRRVLSGLGEPFSRSAQEDGPHGDVAMICRQIPDARLERDLADVFRGLEPPSRDLVTREGHWLRRTLRRLPVLRDNALLTYRDVSAEHFQRFLIQAQRIVMGGLGRQDVTATIFAALARQVEACSAPGTHASILWLQSDGIHLRHVASPTLPVEYVTAIDGVRIGPRVGSCGTAAYTGKPVVVTDIETDELWKDFRAAALRAGLRACWSQPVLGAGAKVLGTLAMYREYPCEPSQADLTLMELAAHMAAMAIRDLRSESEIRFQAALLDSVREAVVAIDAGERIRYWGRGAEKLMCHRAGEIQGRPVHEVLDLSQGLSQARESGLWQGSVEIGTPPAERKIVEVSVSAVEQGNEEREGFVAIVRDITRRKRAEEAMKVSERKLRAQAEELATAHRQKDEFLAMLAHELRNPLAPISNAVQLLKLQNPLQADRTLPWAVDVIDRQVRQISRLVDDLLDIARFTRGLIELQCQHIDMVDIARQAMEAAEVWFSAKGQRVRMQLCEGPVPVCADPARMIQVVSNLLNNASKFTGEQGEIGLDLHCDQGQAVLVVSDNGVGIPSEVLAHVFLPFTQEDCSLDRRQGGLGLGLSVVKKLVEMHAGSVCASSGGPGQGSEFTLRIPLTAPPQSATAPDSRSGVLDASHVELNVLLVDDNAISVDAMALLLETLGHRVSTAYSGPEALRQVAKSRPDLVFLDIGLPVMDGYEVALKLRERCGEETTLIALTGYAPEHAQPHAGRECFDDYVLKPLGFEQLSDLLERHSVTHG